MAEIVRVIFKFILFFSLVSYSPGEAPAYIINTKRLFTNPKDKQALKINTY